MADGYPLQAFLRDVAGIVVEEQEPARIVRLLTPLLRRFAIEGAGLPAHLLHWPHEGAGASLLHEEGDDSFFVIATVLPPGAATTIHYHGDWRAAVLMRGEQEETTYRRADEGSDLTCAEIAEEGRARQTAGSVSAMAAGGYHSAKNDGGVDALLIAILAGTPDDHPYYRYDAEAKALRREQIELLKAAR
ncbi:MAG TPA: hypothetical protein VND24_08685 [Steroidobacteraceae bacterium]|nr:hypothetical protein [Steroidobacteraceae bacterium]